jgi:hypothetical protein
VFNHREAQIVPAILCSRESEYRTNAERFGGLVSLRATTENRHQQPEADSKPMRPSGLIQRILSAMLRSRISFISKHLSPEHSR